MINGRSIDSLVNQSSLCPVTYCVFLARNSRASAAIKAGMDEWTSKTCIRFKARTNERSYVYFRSGAGYVRTQSNKHWMIIGCFGLLFGLGANAHYDAYTCTLILTLKTDVNTDA